MVRLQALLADDDYNIQDFERYFRDPTNLRISDTITCLGVGKYKYMWSIACQKTTITVLYCFNGYNNKADDKKRVILEFNPNKLEYDDFNEIDKIICNLVEISVVRCDLAIDIPIDRKFTHLIKDKRNYEYHDYNKNGKTEYLGVRNEQGFVKLYDKQKESNLEKPMSRLEITVKPSMIEFNKRLPKVICEEENYQTEMKVYDKINPTNQAIISVLNTLDVDTRILALKQFSKFIRKKISPYVLGDTYELEIDNHCVQSVFDWLSNCVYYKTFKQ